MRQADSVCIEFEWVCKRQCNGKDGEVVLVDEGTENLAEKVACISSHFEASKPCEVSKILKI